MRKYLVSYATPGFYKSQEDLKRSALRFGVDEVISYKSEELVNAPFYKENKAVLSHKRGAGYWAWKPYIILETMEKASESDAIIYSDAGISIVSSISPLLDLCNLNQGIWLCTNNLKNSAWTKRDCFVLMDCDWQEYWDAKQVQASFQVYIKNNRSLQFVREYLKFCLVPAVVTDSDNICGKENFSDFKEHRHDQSVITNLAVKYKVLLYRNPGHGGDSGKMPRLRRRGDWLVYPYRYDSSPDIKSAYGTIFEHHRNKGIGKRIGIKIHAFLPRWLKLIDYHFMRFLINMITQIKI